MKQLEARAPALVEQIDIWNSARTDYPREKAIAQLFEEVVSTYPEFIALTFENQQITYADLNAGANRLAQRLRDLGVGPEIMVGCCVERSIELIVALIAVLKAGGAYVPLDPAYPKERLRFFLEDTRTKVVLTDKATRTLLAGCCPDSQLLDIGDLLASGSSSDNLPPAGGPSGLAYVMYTSGSTGLPKGVMVENRAVVRLVRNTNFCRLGPDEVFLQFAPISFDASTFEIWGALLNGGRLVVMPPQQTSLADLGRVIRDQNVTVLWLTSGLFNLMVEERLEDLKHVRQLLAGGDVLSARHVRLLLERLPNCHLINGYGPTENTTFTCCHVMKAGDPVPTSVPIGRPIANTQVFILDEQLRLVAPGEIGELYAAGDGLARGYLNNPEATELKFIQHSFSKDRDLRIYRTGDLARMSPDGVVEFLGRTDHQIKIRGHRVEPGEIEAALEACESITQSCVVARSDKSESKYLAAYYVSSGCGVNPATVRRFLGERLPQYMIPAVLMRLDSLPLTSNGKVDRAALPAPTVGIPGEGVEETAATELEQVIMGIWRDVLSIDRIGPRDNFFDLGGNSLLILGMHAKLQEVLRVQVPITVLFEFTTPQSLAMHLGGTMGSSFSDSQQRARRQRAAFARQRERRVGSPT